MVVGFIRKMVKDIDAVPPENSGVKFTIWLAAMYIGLKGFYAQYTTSSTVPFLRDILGFDSQVVGEISTFRKLPWSMKPGFALVSDILPIFGFKKRSYVFVFALMGTIASCCLVLSPVEVLAGWEGKVAALFFFSVNVYIAGTDILTQGKYTVMAKIIGGSIVSFVIFSSNAAQMIVLGTIGYLNDINPRIPMMIAMPFGIQMFIFASLNFMGDEKKDFGKCCGIDRELLTKHSRTMKLAAVQVLCAVGLMAMTLWPGWKAYGWGWPWLYNPFGPYLRLVYVIIFSIVIISMAFWALPTVVAKCNAYLYLCKIMQLSAGSAMTFFYTRPRGANAVPCEGNPNFDYTFFQTYSGLMDKAVTLLGVVLFERYVRHWNARPAFWVTTLLTCLAGMFDIVCVERWNRDIFGVSDQVTYFFGSTCIEGLVETLDELPATLLISKLSPKDVETTVFAILMANTNLGGTISSYIAVDAQKLLGVNYSGKECTNPRLEFAGMDLTALTWILILGDIILPLLTIPLTWLLIPDVPLESDFSALSKLAPPQVEVENARIDAGFGSGPLDASNPDKIALRRALTEQSTVQEQGTSEISVLTAATMRSHTRQLDAEMM